MMIFGWLIILFWAVFLAYWVASVWHAKKVVHRDFAGVWRIDREERFMTQLFPKEYPEYKKRTKKLIPFVW